MTKRRKCNDINAVIEKFHKDIRIGPVFVCTVCHRLMYKEGVVNVRVAKYKHHQICFKKYLIQSFIFEVVTTKDGYVKHVILL